MQPAIPASEPSHREEEIQNRKPVSFIHNSSFESTAESDLDQADLDLYVDEESPTGLLDASSASSSLLKSLKSSRLLTFEGEQLLFKKLNFLRFRASAIQVSLPEASVGKLSSAAKKKTRELDRLLSEAEAVRRSLAEANLRLVVSIAGKLANSREEFDEFVAEGNGILLYAIDKFDFSRGFRFSTYVTHAVQRHLFRIMNRRRKRSEWESAREPDILASEVIAKPEADQISDDEMQRAAATIIARIDETLNERERFIVRGRFGLDGTAKGKTFSAMGKQLGLSKERVRQLCQKGLEQLGEVARPFESLFSNS